MTDNNLYRTVRLPAGRWGTVIKTAARDGMQVYNIRADDNGEIVTMIEIAEGELIPLDDHERLIAMVRGIRDGTVETIETTEWTDGVLAHR